MTATVSSRTQAYQVLSRNVCFLPLASQSGSMRTGNPQGSETANPGPRRLPNVHLAPGAGAEP